VRNAPERLFMKRIFNLKFTGPLALIASLMMVAGLRETSGGNVFGNRRRQARKTSRKKLRPPVLISAVKAWMSAARFSGTILKLFVDYNSNRHQTANHRAD